MSKEILAKIVDVLPFLTGLFVEPTSLMVSDLEESKLIRSIEHPQLPHPLKEGDSLPEAVKQSQTYEKIMSGQGVFVRLPKGTYGIALPTITGSIPIFDDEHRQVVGLLGLVQSTERYDNLMNIGQDILAAMEQLYATAENLTVKGQSLSEMSKNMNLEIAGLKDHATRIGNISDQIGYVSSRTNILGINAAIESARLGEQGRGFKIVAEEVRKLAEETKSSARDIDTRIKVVQEAVGTLINSIHEMDVFTESQAAGIDELRNALEHIAAMAGNLVRMGTLEEGGKKAQQF